MALSFEQSLQQSSTATPSTAVEDYGIATLSVLSEEDSIAAYSGETAEWTLNENYLYYEDYSDSVISNIDSEKNIIVSSKQINITQEVNSQYIPFEMDRYYDGFDLLNTTILIHFVNKDGYEDLATPINVYFNDTRIKFAWLVDKRVTSIEGKVKFEIQAIGVNSKGDEYVWKTKPNGELNILKSLSGNGIIEPDETWTNSFLAQVTEQVGLAQAAAQEAKDSITEVESYSAAAAESAEQAQTVVDEAKAELKATVETTVNTKVSDALTDYYTKPEVDEIVKNIDISDQLTELETKQSEMEIDLAGVHETINRLPETLASDYYTKTVTDETFATKEGLVTVSNRVTANSEALSAYKESNDAAVAQVQTNLNEYTELTDADLASIHKTIDGLPETLAADYYTKTATDEKFATKESVTAVQTSVSAAEGNIETNKQNIATLGTKVGELETAISGIDQSPRLSYEATYDEEYTFTLWEIEGEGDSEERSAKSQFKIQGGSGSGGTSSVLKIEYVTKTPLVATVNDNISITYKFSGTDSSGDEVQEGVATWKVGSAVVATNTAVSGENTFDITQYISLGTQKVVLSITDDAGSLVTKSWTVQKIDVRLESTFNDTLTYPIGTVTFDYTPYGAISKEVHFILDGKEVGTVTTSASGIPMGYNIPSQEHGAHLLEVYMTATVNNNVIESNHIFKDIIWYDSTSTVPVISTVSQEFTARQYDTTNISYTVYDPATETPTVELAVDGTVVSTRQIESSTDIWQFKATEAGTYTLTITCGETVKILAAIVEELDIEIEPVTAGLVVDFDPTGKTNVDADREWTNGTYSMKASDNFDWVQGGYQFDSNGDQYFCIKAGTSVELDYQLFADDAKRNGKEMKLVFKTTNVQAPDAKFLSCVDNTTDANHIGIEMFVHEAYIYGQSGKLYLPYSEEDIIEFEFNISKNTESVPMVLGYEDGVPTAPMVYDDSFDFTQTNPKTVVLGSDKCDLHVYRLKIYNTSLTDRGILNNYIADARNAEEMVDRYNRNQIYDENQNLDPYVLAEKCPWLRVIIIRAPYFTNNKSDKVPNTTIEYIYKDGDPVLDNWRATDCLHSGQGTSSNNYGASGRNLDLIMKSNSDFGNTPVITLGDGVTTASKVSLTRNSVPANYFNFKINIASSENANNALLQKRYNAFNPYKLPYVREEGYDLDSIKTTMEFVNAVVFIQETDATQDGNGNYTTHREFNDTDVHYYGFGNIGDSKKTDSSRLADPDDKYEHIVEIMDVELPLSDWPAGEEAMAALESEQFDEEGTYGLRYIWEDGTDEENAEVFDFVKQKWIEMYKFVVESTDEEFHEHLGDYFVLDSILYYYLFTNRYLMIDNRAKNTFVGYAKTGELDANGQPVRKYHFCFDYDNDSSLGLNNYGDLVYRYGMEDTDYDDNGEEIFREMDSMLWCRVRDNFGEELKTLYNTLESQGAWSAENLISQFDVWQDEFPEELWRLDIQRKYIRTYTSSFINGAGDSQFLVNMMKGKKKYQRRQFERSQEKYMASKYQSSVASSDNAVIRATSPEGNLAVSKNYRLKLTPYAYMYLNVKYGTQAPIQMRVEPNIEYEIPFTGDSADIIDIYSCSLLTSLGDLAPVYAATVDTSKAVKLKELNIGSDVAGYDNPSLTTLTLGANYLLEKLNVENVSGLTQSLNLSALANLKEVYAHGSNVSGATFAEGGRIEIAELPAINAISMKNLAYLTTLDIASFDKLTTLTVENCTTVDLISILNAATSLNRARITGVDWILEDTVLLERIYEMSGIDKSGYNIDQSVLTGKVHVPVIRQQQLRNYQAAWSDLEVVADTIIEQFAVTFVNDDGTVLEVQYVDKGSDAIDPTTREEDPLIPVKESSVSHDFTFASWDGTLEDVFSDRTITATYTESLRTYTIKYVSKGTIMQESTGLYGENVPYTGIAPTYTGEESGYVYYLFNRWDKSGFIDGDKTVNAVFDKFEYTEGIFNNKELSEMTPVEIYALTKLDMASSVITDKDAYSITIGNDVDYDDIESELIISSKMTFDGANYFDSGIQLFDEDKDFVLAIDYEFEDGNSLNSTLAQCFQANGSNGFKLWYNVSSGTEISKFTWGTTATDMVSKNKREMVIIRHKKGENNLTIYNSKLDAEEVVSIELERTKETVGTGTLVFGAAKADDGLFENHAIGNIYWAKVWYRDLGDDVCKDLAMWVHETIGFEACGFRKYYLTENTSKRCSFSLLASNLLGRNKVWNTTNTNSGGWASASINSSLNNRLYNAIPTQIRSLVKQCRIPASIGDKSTEIATSDCYITIPAVFEVDPTMTTEPYVNESTSISYMTTDEARIRKYADGTAGTYWTRSANVSYSNYVFRVDDTGALYGYSSPNYEAGVLIEISF